jgi:glycosidase
MKMALVFLLTTRGIPQLYYGDELAMPGGFDPDNRRDMRWDWLEPESSTEEARRAREMFAFTRELIALRRGSPALCWGMHAVLYVTPTLLVYIRFALDDIVIVCLNNAPAAVNLRVPIRTNPGIPALMREKLVDGLELKSCLCCGPGMKVEEGGLSVQIADRGAAVYRARPPSELSAGRLRLTRRQKADFHRGEDR